MNNQQEKVVRNTRSIEEKNMNMKTRAGRAGIGWLITLSLALGVSHSTMLTAAEPEKRDAPASLAATREMDGQPVAGRKGLNWRWAEIEIEWGFQESTGKLACDGSIESTYNLGVLGAAKPLPEDKTTTMTGERTWKSPAAPGARRGIVLPVLYTDEAYGPDRTILTVRTTAGSFSFQPVDLMRGPMLVAERGFFIRDLSPKRAAEALAAAKEAAILSSENLLRDKLPKEGPPGWCMNTASVSANPASEPLKLLQGDLVVPPRAICVHPDDYRDVAVAWQSPIAAKVRLRAKVTYGHSGDGISWSVVHERPAGRKVLAQGSADRVNRSQVIPAVTDTDTSGELAVQKGDGLALVINKRGTHLGDTTFVEVAIVEVGVPTRTWDLTKDVVEDLGTANPHPDSFGHAGVWHFLSPPSAKSLLYGFAPVPSPSQATTAREYLAELARHRPKTTRQRVRELPEQTWEGAMEAMHGKRPWPAFPQVPVEPKMVVEVPCQYLGGLWRIGAWQIIKHCPRIKRADVKKLPSIATWAREIPKVCQVTDAKDPEGIYVVPDHPFIPLACETDRILEALDQMGMHDVAEDGFTIWLENQQPDGALFISSYDDTRHSIGALTLLCAAMEHYQLTGDRSWLEREKPRLQKAVQWIIDRRRKSLKEDLSHQEAEQLRLGRNWSPYGLQLRMPCGDGEQGRYIFLNDAGAYRSVLMCGQAFSNIDPASGARLLQEAAAHRRDLWKVVNETVVLSPVIHVRDGTYRSFVPQSFADRGPYTRVLPKGTNLFTHRGHFNCDIVIPLASIEHWLKSGLLSLEDPRVDGHFDVLEDAFLSNNPWHRTRKADYDPDKDWFSHAGWGYQSGWERIPDYYLLSDDIPNFLRAWLNRCAVDLDLGQWTFREHTFQTGGDKSHGYAVFLSNFRNMLVMEIGEALWLARATPRAWLTQGKKVSIKNSPTHFGTVAYEIVSDVDNGKINGTVELPARKVPKEVVLRFRHPKASPIKGVTVNGNPWTGFNKTKETITLKGLTGTIAVTAEY
jgi:hypothetical protein